MASNMDLKARSAQAVDDSRRGYIRLIGSLAIVAALALAGSAGAKVHPAHGSNHSLTGHAVVVAAEPDASDAGLKVLRAGGNAIDAAVAIQAVLSMEEPQSSGVGGGAFLVYYDARTHRTTVYSGREKAPSTATPQLFYDEAGKPLGILNAIMSGRSTGAPGAIAMLAKAQADHGKLAWKDLFGDARRLALEGFKVPPRMGAAINSSIPMGMTPDAKAYFTKPDGQRYKTGEVMQNQAYAHALDLIAAHGAKGLLTGEIAQAIVTKTTAPPIPGALTLADLEAYTPQVMEPVCRPYRAYLVCTNPPPGSGAGVLELLSILSHTDIDKRDPKDPQAWLIFAQASRLMYADRDHFIGDPDFVKVPVGGLLDPTYGASRAALIPTVGAAAPAPGAPMGAVAHGPDATHEPGGTTHMVIIDAQGNIASMTTTVEAPFGSGRMVSGFFLNNQLTDFSSPTGVDGQPAANAPGPSKRPRSSMSPVIIFDRQGKPVAAFGSPGGNSIVAYVAKTIVGWIDWKLPLQDAVNLPNVVARGGVISVEKGMDPAVVDYLKSKGLPVKPDAGETSGINGVVLHARSFETAVDPRREAVARSY